MKRKIFGLLLLMIVAHSAATVEQALLAARFVPQCKQLLVLTATQRVYRIDLSTLSAGH